MTCDKCKDIIERTDIPHTIRVCEGCGRTLHVYEPGEGGKGMRVREGDRFVIPAGWMKLSLNPLKGAGNFTRAGLAWFAELIFLEDLPQTKGAMKEELEGLAELCYEALRTSPILSAYDIENPEHANAMIDILKDNRNSVEWWALLVNVYLSVVQDAMKQGDTERAIWAMACAERCRSMMVFKEYLEEVVWIGQSARRLIDVLQAWDSNQTNSDEQYWHELLTENSYILSQVFSVPVLFVQDKAYVGGMRLDRTDARFVDFLYSSESSNNAMLIELKTPSTRLIGGKYRGTYKPSSELAGATVQLLDYRNQLSKNVTRFSHEGPTDISPFDPKCVLIIGNANRELDTEEKRHAFELYRTGLKDVEIVTYDELFRKIEILARLFNLVRQEKIDEAS